MPSFLHEALVDMLRRHPELVLGLLRAPNLVKLPAYDTIVSDSADLGAAVSTELSADCLLRVERSGQTVLVIVIEVQLAIDLHKSFSWPAYAVGARTRHRCDVMLVVVTPYHRVASWARKPIELGPLSGTVQPTVIGPDEMPAILNAEEARNFPELAVLSAITHGQDDNANRAAAIAITAMAAVFTLPDHRAQVYYDLIRSALSVAARKALRMIPQNYQYQDEGLRRAKAEGELKGKAEGELKGKAEGELKGKAEGELKGKAEGELKGKAEGELHGTALAVIGVLEARGFSVTPEARNRVLNCIDVEQLRVWLVAAVSAASVEAALSVAAAKQ